MPSYIHGRAARRLSDPEIVALYVGGLDSETIGAKADCSASVVLGLVRRAGETVRPPGGRGGRRKRALDEAEICRRYALGATGPEIAEAAGCVLSTVYTILRRHGVVRRPRVQPQVAAAAQAARKRKREAPP